MYRSYDDVNGLPPRVYRDTEEIKDDIRLVALRINEINEMLNIRELVAALAMNDIDSDPVRSAEAVRELADRAEDAIAELSSLNESLDALRAELITVHSAIG
ncbi:MAG: hypothetical protein E7617_04375 [Ruminococcaceae bacterium]|nr:hypothetical protein [Oscillospiraceae bacterium]